MATAQPSQPKRDHAQKGSNESPAQINRELAHLPEEIQKEEEQSAVDKQTQQAERSITKLALLIAAVVIIILLVVGIVWLI